MAAKRPRLVEAREAMRYTQEGLADELGINPRTVRRWELGEVIPQPWLLPKLARILGKTDPELALLLDEPESAAPGVVLASGAATVGPRVEFTAQTGSHDDVELLTLVDRTRLLVDQTLSTGVGSSARLRFIEDRAAAHVQAYTRTPPMTVLRSVAPDLIEIQSLAAQRQPAAVQSRLSEATSVLGLLLADALMKLGQIGRARYWYCSARLAADDTPNPRLQAQARAQEAMLPYYYGQIEHTVALAREARSLVPHTPCAAAALAAAAEGRALARLGDRDGAELAMADARTLVDGLEENSTDAAFQFDRKRLLLYLSGTLTYLDETARAGRVQDEALTMYRADPRLVIDPALIMLDRAVGEARRGDSDQASQRAIATLVHLPAEHRTRIVLARADDVVAAIPAARRSRPAVTELRELMTTQGQEHTT